MSDILFPTDTTSVTPATWDIILIADVSDSNNLKETTLAELPISTATQTALNAKQDTLVSWTNIKTVNGNSLLGSGDVTISGGVSTLDALTDVVIATPTTGQALVYDGTKWENTTLPGGGDALTTNPLSQFASTTSLQLKNTISDETGSGSLVFATSPTLVTPTLGTPASWTLTNCIDLPLAGLVDINTNRILGRSTAGTGAVEELNVTAIPALIGLWTSDSPQFTGVNIGHATDTTMTRVSAGKIAVEGVNQGTEWILQNSQSAAYTLVLEDAGKHIYHPSADTTARIWTIPANASVAFPIGTAVTFINDTSAGTLTISITTDTLVLAGAGTTGSRTLTANGIATAVKVTSTRWIISGTSNLT